MKMFLRNISIILLIVSVIIPFTKTFALEAEEQKEFFEISKLEVNKNEKVEMIINLEVIEYNEFLFTLESSENLKNIEINDKITTSTENLVDIEIEENNKEIEIYINKKITNLNTITLYYQVPENLQVKDIIKFKATITNIEEEIENTKSIEKEVKIIEETQQSAIINEAINSQNSQTQTTPTVNIVQQSNSENIGNNNTVQQITYNIVSGNNQSTEQTVKYNGSSNNYLNSLTVSGYELNKDFSKDNSTYFITVENTVESLEISATAEESTSKICIYGNENLGIGTNKILITVTAENGSVRNYRIFVTKNS